MEWHYRQHFLLLLLLWCHFSSAFSFQTVLHYPRSISSPPRQYEKSILGRSRNWHHEKKYPDGYHLRRSQLLRQGQQCKHCCSQLYLFPSPASLGLTTNSIMALSTVTISSLIGFFFNRIRFLGGNGGTIVTLVSAALLSNIGNLFGGGGLMPMVPTSHFIYDICWEKLLPASLALVLLSSSNTDSNNNGNNNNVNHKLDGNNEVFLEQSDQNNQQLYKETIMACAVPFLIGSIGSILGCFLAAILLTKYQAMQPLEAAIAAGCLCASYIGGSVNFFATAKVISISSIFRHGSNTNIAEMMMNNLLSAMATADLLIMAIYFGGLSAMLSWKRLSSLFPGRCGRDFEKERRGAANNDHNTMRHSLIQRNNNNNKSEKNVLISTSTQKKDSKINRSLILPSTFGILLLTFIIVEASIMVENCIAQRLCIPGMCCASVAAMGSIINTYLNKIEKAQIPSLKTKSAIVATFRDNLNRIGRPLSELCFLALFSAVGVSANLGTVFSRGKSSFTFAILALIVHILMIGFGSFAIMRIIPNNKIFPLAAEEVLVASNAGIGGASTAAAFAGNLDEKRVSSNRKRALIYAGTAWGVIGYALATPIGVILTKILGTRL